MSSENSSWDKEIAEIHQRRALAKGHGGQEAVAHHHAKGRMTLRERIDCLIDAGSFKESGMGAGGAVKDKHGNPTEPLQDPDVQIVPEPTPSIEVINLSWNAATASGR